MKKLLLAMLVLFGLQTKAQTWCDSINMNMEVVEDNQTPWILQYYLNGTHDTTGGMNMVHDTNYSWTIQNLNISPPCADWYTGNNILVTLPSSIYDTLKICLTLDFLITDCTICDTLIWDNGSWNLLSATRQPYFCCDSITYWTDQSQGFNIGLDTTNITHTPDSIEVLWSICNSSQCYTGQGMYDYFPQIMTTDTIKACYDAYLYTANTVEVCTHCDSLIFDGFNWVLFNMGNTTSINELTFNRINDNKMYDLMGREIINVSVGTIYIKNGKKYFLSE